MEFDRVKLDVEGNVGVLAFNHPEVRNAVSPEMLNGLMLAMDYVEDPANGLRALVMTGEGKGYCAGANFAAGGGDNSGRKPDAGSALEERYHPFLRRLRNLEMPLITAVNGAAAGVGMSFALMGDMVLAGKSAFFMQAFRHRGLVPDGGSTWLLPRLVGVQRAKELSLLGDRLPAEKALEWGLINRVYEDDELMGAAKEMAQEMANGPTVALSLIRNLYWESTDNSYEEQLNLERQSQRIAGRSEDFEEGVRAFLEKRDPKFTGK